MDDDELEFADDEDLIYLPPSSYKWSTRRFLATNAVLIGAVAANLSQYFLAVANQLMADVAYRDDMDEFRQAAAQEIETITEEQANG